MSRAETVYMLRSAWRASPGSEERIQVVEAAAREGVVGSRDGGSQAHKRLPKMIAGLRRCRVEGASGWRTIASTWSGGEDGGKAQTRPWKAPLCVPSDPRDAPSSCKYMVFTVSNQIPDGKRYPFLLPARASIWFLLSQIGFPIVQRVWK